MRHLLLASLVIVALSVSPVFAITVDGDLSDWGVTPPTDWTPNPGIGISYNTGNDVVNSSNSGGEWYDIEALYINLNLTTNAIEWGMITSYRGAEPSSGAALPPGASSVTDLRNGYVWDGSSGRWDRAWSMHPYLALSFNDDDGGTDVKTETWEFGIVMAPNREGTIIPDDATGFSGAAELWSVGAWRGGHPNEFGPGDEPGYNPTWYGPVDFDRADTTTNTQLSTGSSWAVRSYGNEAKPGAGTTWWESRNWAWEGSIQMPTSVMTFDSSTSVEYTYAIWCANNHTQGDRIGQGAPPADDSPEAATWALLLCTAAMGGFARRRRKG